MKSDVALVKCDSYDSALVEKKVREAVLLLGGIEKFIKPGSRVLVNPNLLTPNTPDTAVDTHPEVVRAVIRILKDINAKIYLGDSPSAFYGDRVQIEEIWNNSGMKKVAEEEGVELVEFSGSYWDKKFPLTTWLKEVDYLISVPKFKTHNLMILTGAIKNLYGLIPGVHKIELHKQHHRPKCFARTLVDLFEIVAPQLTIVDGITAIEGEGPGSRGNIRNPGLVIAGHDCVSIDSILAMIMGLGPEDILTTQQAAARNLGNSKLENIQILGEQLDVFKSKPFELPQTYLTTKFPYLIVKLFATLVRFYPEIDPKICDDCGACVKVCPQKIMISKKGRVYIKYSKCISCFCCQEVCPHAAIGTKKSLLAKLLKL